MFDTMKPVYDPAPTSDKIASTLVAEVEGRLITLGEVGDTIRALPSSVGQLPFESLYPVVLEELIKEAALAVRARQQGIDEDPAIRRRVRAAAERQLAEEYLQKEASRTITEAALIDYYNRDIAGRPGEEEVRARVILVATKDEAVDLIAEIRRGADFATVARRASKDSTASAGGDLDFHGRDAMNPEVGSVAFSLAIGETSSYPVRTEAGWLIVKTEARRQQPTPGFAAVSERLRRNLLQAGFASLSTEALKDLTIRRYSFTGAEVRVDNSMPTSKER
jgi:peptidyl-prolyl cis-trans isomerase C